MRQVEHGDVNSGVSVGDPPTQSDFGGYAGTEPRDNTLCPRRLTFLKDTAQSFEDHGTGDISVITQSRSAVLEPIRGDFQVLGQVVQDSGTTRVNDVKIEIRGV